MDLRPTNPGDFRQSITIQSPSESQNAYGEEVITWQTFAQSWAKITQLSGREQYYAQEVTPLATHQVKLRYLAGVTPAMQIVWGSRTLQIIDVNDLDGRQIELALICQEKK
jgi:SPP1 family predicted phage head-tail adaptor